MQTDATIGTTENPNLNHPSIERPLRELAELVAIDSSSKNPVGVNQVQDWLVAHLEPLGFVIQRMRHPENIFADLLVAEKPATDPSLQDHRVSFLMHADTVHSLATQQDLLHFHNDRLFGPGVADDKGGIIVALEGLRKFLAQNLTHGPLMLVCSPNEELGSIGFTSNLNELGLRSKVILGFEPAHESGCLISSRHGNRWYKIAIQGIEAHSGRANGEEVNAAHELSHKIVEIIQLRQQRNDIKLNIGSLKSGRDKYNIVCGAAEAKLDFRFPCVASRDQLHQQILQILRTPRFTSNKGEIATTQVTIADDCPPFPRYKDNERLLEQYKSLISNIENCVTECHHGGGASDINHMSHANAFSLDGLGPIGGRLHTNDEFIIIESLRTRSEALSQFLSFYFQDVKKNSEKHKTDRDQSNHGGNNGTAHQSKLCEI